LSDAAFSDGVGGGGGGMATARPAKATEIARAAAMRLEVGFMMPTLAYEKPIAMPLVVTKTCGEPAVRLGALPYPEHLARMMREPNIIRTTNGCSI
jgi:hypothetical protein